MCTESGDHGDAAEAFLQAVPLREENLQEVKGNAGARGAEEADGDEMKTKEGGEFKR